MVTAVDEIIGNPQVINFAPNQILNSIMPNTAVEDHWDLLLEGTLTLAGYTTAPSKFVEDLENLIYTVQVSASAAVPGGVNEVFKNCDAAYFRFITNLYTQQDVTRTDIGTANGAYDFLTTPRINFGDPIAVDAKTGKLCGSKYWLDARLLSASGLQLNVGFRDQTAMVYGGVAGTATLSNTSVQVKARHYFGIPNQTAQGATIARLYLREVQQQYPVLQTGISQQFTNLRTGAVLHRLTLKGLVAPSTTGVSFADPSDLPLGSNFTREAGPLLVLQVNNNAYTPLSSVYSQLQNADVKLFKLANVWRAGYNVFEPSTSHSIQGMLNLRAAVNMILTADTEVESTPTSIQLSYVERVKPQ
jgi:hypothetical protein